MTRSNSRWIFLSVVLGMLATTTGSTVAATFTSLTPIVIPGPSSSDGSASVYPSVISVSGLVDAITSLDGVSVDIRGFTATDPSDVGLALVGPTGAALVLMGAAGGNTSGNNLNIDFSDSGSQGFPQTAIFNSGTFKPAQYAPIGSFPSPGPLSSVYESPAPFGTSTFFSTFENTNPNGDWSLYAFDPVSGDSGQIASGWILQIDAPAPEPSTFILAALGGLTLLALRR